MSCKGCVRRPLVFSGSLQMGDLQTGDNQEVMNKRPADPVADDHKQKRPAWLRGVLSGKRDSNT